jgi:hypothetical protein
MAAVEAEVYGKLTFKEIEVIQRYWIMKRVNWYTGLIGGSVGHTVHAECILFIYASPPLT